jgi:hypothetical protein
LHYGIDQLMKDHHDALTGIKALSSPQAVDIGCWRRAKQPNATGGLRDERGEKFYFQPLRVTACSCIRWTATHSAEHVLRHAPAVSAMRTRLERPSTEAATGAEKKIRCRMTKSRNSTRLPANKSLNRKA